MSHVDYVACDASTATFDRTVDIVVALHACGGLSDVAIGHALAHRAAAFVVAPCCYCANANLQVPCQ